MVGGVWRWTGALLAVLLGAFAAWFGSASVVAQTLMPTGDPAEAWTLSEVNGDTPKPGDTPTRVIAADSADQAAIAAAGSKQPGFLNETRVLCLHSHTPDDGYTILQSRGFFEAIKKKAPGPVSLFREYLFLQLRGEDDGYHEALVDLLKRRYAGVPISIVMITDTRALKFWLDHLRDSMPGVPAVFSGSFQWFPEFDEPDRMITGAMEKVHAAATVDLIQQILPKTRHVAVMGSASFFGNRMRDAFDEQLAGRGAEGPKVTYYTPTTWERILVPFQGNDAADAMIYVAGPVGLSPGTHHYPPRWLQEQIPGGVPAFALFDAAMGPDVIGGVVCSGTKMGEIAGIAAGRILFDGVKPADIPIDRGDGSRVPVFRWDAIRKWGIDESSLPAGSEVIGRPESWLARHETGMVRGAAILASGVALALGLVSWGLVRSRRRLSETQGRMELMASSLGEAFWIAEPDGWTIRYATEAWEVLWGRPRTSITGHAMEALLSWIHPEDREAMRRKFEARPGDSAPMDNTFRVVHPDGSLRWINCKSGPLFDEAGQVTCYVGVQRDISDKMESRRALQESERRLTELVRNAPLAVIEWDDQWRCTRWDGLAESMFGWTQQEVLGKTHDEIEFIHADDAAAVRAAIEHHEALRTSVFRCTNRHLTKTGEVRLCEWIKSNRYDEHGKRTSTLSMVLDVSDRAAAQLAQEKSERRLASLIRNAPLGVIEWDDQWRCTRWDGQAEAIFGWSEPEVLGQDFREWKFVHEGDADRVVEVMREQERGRLATFRSTNRNYTGSGDVRVCEWTNTNIFDDSGKRIVTLSMVADVTEREEARRALGESEERYRLVARAATDIIWDWDIARDSVRWSDAAKDLPRGSNQGAGLSIGEWIDHMHPDDRERVRAGFFGALNDPSVETWRDDYRMLQDGGGVAHYTDQGFIVRDSSGKAVRMVGAMKDVTEARAAAEQLAASEQRLRAAMKAAGLGTFNVDLRTGAMEHDERTAEIFGLPPGERITNFDARRQYFHPDDLPGVGERERIALTTDQNYRCEARVRHAGGEYRWILGQASVLRDADGKPVRAVGVVGDIHDQRTANEALRRSEERFRELAGTVEQGFWVRSLKTGEYEYFSPAIARMLGVRDEDLPRGLEEVRRIVHPDDIDELRRSSAAWLAAGCRGVLESEFRVVLPVGRVRWWRSRAYAGPRGVDGAVERIMGTTEDVTDRMEAARRLAESEAKFREIAETIRQVFWVSDPGGPGLVRYVSGAVKEVFGLDASEVEGTEKGWAQLIHPDDVAAADARRLAWYEGDSVGSYENFYRIVRPDGEVRHIHNRGYAVRDDRGRVVRVAGLAEDVTERETARLKLESSERRFREMAENIDQVFWVRSIEKPEIGYVSPATKRLWGVDPETLIGSVDAWRRMIHPDDRAAARERIDRWIAGGTRGQHEAEFRIVTPSGEIRWVRSRAVAIGDGSEGSRRIVGVTEDITTRKTAELALENTLRTQRLLLSELDHRVKNNLAGLLALIEMSAAPGRTVEGFAEAMRRRVGGMVEVHAVLSSSRWEALDLSNMVAVLSPADVPGRLRVEGPSVAVPPSKATPLGMVLQELLSNSQKYGALGTTGGEVSLVWSTVRDKDTLWLTMEWTERGGPPIESTPASGLGTSLIEGFSRYELRGQASLSYPRDGARHTIRVDLSTDSARRGGRGSAQAGHESQANGHAGTDGDQGAVSSPAVLSTSTTGV